ncbi:MAG: dephospho-CoA kinase [Paraprevotella sp.]|nr:dephospho-CoA kinase [Paraprevotella sp.]
MTLRIGITGGIGSGKSFVCRLLAERGVPVYSCDEEAGRLMENHPCIREALTDLLGEEIYTGEGRLNKPLLAAWLFASSGHAEQVNAIVHPVVKRDFVAWAQRQTVPVVAVESAILFEAGMDTLVDRVLLVDAPREVRLRRTMLRDGATREQVEHRMNCQMPDEERRLRARDILYNDGRNDLKQEVERLLAVWKGLVAE